MAVLYLTDVVVRCLPQEYHAFHDDSRLFLDVVAENKTTRFGPLTRQSASSWNVQGNIDLPASAPSVKIAVLLECSGQRCNQLGVAELAGDYLLARCLEPDIENVQTFVTTENISTLEIAFSCFVIPSEDPPEIASHPQGDMQQETTPLSVLDAVYEGALLLPNDDPEKLVSLYYVGAMFICLYTGSGDRLQIDKAISALDHALEFMPDGHPLRPPSLGALGTCLLTRYEYSSTLSNIDRAIFSLEFCITLTSQDELRRSALFSLGIALRRRFECLGERADIDKSVSAHQDVIRLTPEGNADKPDHLSSLGLSYLRRFNNSSDLADLELGVSSHEDAIRLSPEGHANKPYHLSNLGCSYLRRFENSADLADIELAISLQKDAIRLAPEGYAYKLALLNNIGNSYLRRSQLSGDPVDIESAISYQKDAVHLTPEGHVDRPSSLNDLGISFACRFQNSGDLADIESAISYQKDALRLTPEGHADKPGIRISLGASYLHRFRHSGDIVDIDSAISYQKDAVCLTPEGHVDKPGHLTNLGNSLMSRFERSGGLGDIDSAISYQKDAVRLTPEGHAEEAAIFNNLGNSFMRRFEFLRDPTDIDSAISYLKDAVRLTPEGHADRPGRLNNLGGSFKHRFENSKDLDDIAFAISYLKLAVHLTNLTENHANKHRYLYNLGTSFSTRFERLRDPADIELAISFLKDALRLTPDGHAEKPARLNSLGISFLSQFEHSEDRDPVVIDSAISYQKDAVCLTPEGHVNKPHYLTCLGLSLQCRFEHSGDPSDIMLAIEQFRLSANSSAGPPLLRFNAALKWARLAFIHRLNTSLEGYFAAINLLPRVAWLGQTISDRHKALIDIGGAANEAAAAAIRSGNFGSALEWLEQGRSIVWGQLLNLRNPVDELRSERPHLADDLVRVSKVLEKASIGESYVTPSNQQGVSLEEAAQRHRRLAQEWDSLIEKARAVPGFEDFLRPKKLATLSKAAQSGPVVTINVYESRCDALILTPDHDNVIHLPLDRFSYDQAQELQRSLHQSLSAAGVRMRDARAMKRESMSGHDGLSEILSTLWSNVVKPVLDSLAYSVSSDADPPRIWWCPTGPLCFLPIHAAGDYSRDTVGSKVSDFVTSSYAPTLTALLERSKIPPTTFQGLLAVAQPCTSGLSRLPCVEKELTQIKQLGSNFYIDSLSGEQATVENVVRGMGERSWIHLACHAVQDISEPTQSALCLHDGRLTLSKTISNSFPHADFAFLSACQTAKGDIKLSEEAVHLAAGMLAAGYRSVIATMWSIKDNDAPLVAQEVYSRLFGNSSPDSSRAAHALHHAVKRLREELMDAGERSFLSWVPFIHVGV